MTIEADPPTAEELLGRLPEIPHIGSYGRKDIIVPPYIKGNEVEPKQSKKTEEHKEEEKKEEKGA